MTNELPSKEEALDYDNDLSEKQRYYALLVRELQSLKEEQDPPGEHTVDQCLRRVHDSWTKLTESELLHVKEMIESVDEESLEEEQYQDFLEIKERYHDLQRQIDIIQEIQSKAFK